MLAHLVLPLALALAQPASPATAEPSPMPEASASAAPSATPPPVATPSAAPTPNLFPYVIVPAANGGGGPHILQIALNDRVQHLGKTLLVKVSVSPDVTGVTVSSMGETIQLPPAGPGAFGAMQELPSGFPYTMYAGRDYVIDIVASTADGHTAKATITMRLER